MPEFWVNSASTLGIALLAFPALKLNKLKRRQAAALANLSASQDRNDDLLAAVAQLGVNKRGHQVATWSAWDQVCLHLGYALLLGSNILRLLLLS